MAYEIIDENRIPVALGVSNADGTTVIPIYANATSHSLFVKYGISGTDLTTNDEARRNDNRKVAFFAVSATDGVTPVAIYADPVTNRLLLDN